MPKVFLSSTVRDLADLRSAIKYWLEENGFEVLASEWPDFPNAIDRNAIDAALAPIADCDYYLLIVGSRVGSVIEGVGISVTRAEFRHAREVRRKAGKPNMLHLVRRDLNRARARERPSNVSDEDWPAIQEFLREIEEEGDRTDPNWVREFDSFRDIVDAVRSTFRITGPLTTRALETNLQWELKATTRGLLSRGRDVILPNALWFPYDLKLPQGLTETIAVDYKTAFAIFRFRLTVRRMAPGIALDEAIRSGRFLEYDVATNSFVVGPLQRGLLELRQQIQNLDGLANTIATDDTVAADNLRLAEGVRKKQDSLLTVFTGRMLYAAFSASMNALALCRAIYRVVVGLDKDFGMPKLEPLYAGDEKDRMQAEEVTDPDADRWLRWGDWRLPVEDAPPT